MEQRGVEEDQDHCTPQQLRDPGCVFTVEERVQDPIGLHSNRNPKFEFARNLSHTSRGEEPLVFWNELMRELHVDVSRRDWTEATRGLGNIVRMAPIEPHDIVNETAGAAPTRETPDRCIAATAACLASAILVQKSEEGTGLPIRFPRTSIRALNWARCLRPSFVRCLTKDSAQSPR